MQEFAVVGQICKSHDGNESLSNHNNSNNTNNTKKHK